MSFEEKSTWIGAVVGVVVYMAYVVVVLSEAQGSDVAEVAYQRPLLTAIGVAIIVWIVAIIAVGIASPKEADKKDERDISINRYGEFAAYYVLSVGALVALGLALAEIDYLWIANAIYLTLTLAGLTSSVVKIVAYRRGF